MSGFDSYMQARLDERKEKDMLRKLPPAGTGVDFCSNDYLGFVKSGIIQVSGKHAEGATGSRLLSGNSPGAEKAEETVARYHGMAAALIYNSGYMANAGLLSAIGGRGDTLILDEYAHASIIDGARLSHAARFKFRHNDLADLERKIKKAQGNVFVVVESLYSMDGDEAPLREMTDLCEKYNALLIVDEAHATGVWGREGAGFVTEYNLQNRIFATVYTFGKALGLHGAAVAGSDTLKNYLINFSRPFIYTTALPPLAYAQIQAAYEYLPQADRQALYKLIAYFKSAVKDIKNVAYIESASQVQGIVIGNSSRARALSARLWEKGIDARAILSPTVPEGSERLRICLHSFNTENEIDLLVQEINNFLA